MLTLLMTLPGVAVTYNGDEIGMLDYRDISWEDTLDPAACNTDPENYKWASRDPVRTPFQWDGTAYAGFKDAIGSKPWIQVHPNYETLNLALQKAAPKSFYKFYQQLAELRKDEVFEKGMFESRAFNQEVFGYKRTLGDTSYIVLINFADTTTTIDVNEINVAFPQRSEVVLAGSQSSYDVG
jgi:alpha-glucosidase